MTGMFTDNQPDFTWLAPFEEKTFTQYFMPYKKVGCVQNASTEAVLGLDVQNGEARVCVYATGVLENARVTLRTRDEVLLERTVTLSPTQIFEERLPAAQPAHALTLTLTDADGRRILACTPREKKVEPVPEPAQPALDPAQIATCEELYLTGLHLEQYRHATYLPEDYYLEGLRRDKGDIRLNTAYGMLLLRRAHFARAEEHFRAAIRRSTWKNPNPWNSEPCFGLGLSLLYQNREDEAFDAFYKSVWSATQQEMGFYYLAAICCRQGRFGGGAGASGALSGQERPQSEGPWPARTGASGAGPARGSAGATGRQPASGPLRLPLPPAAGDRLRRVPSGDPRSDG